MSKIKELRKAAGLTQQQLADKAEIKLRTLVSYEQNQRNPEGMALLTAIKLADVLGCEPRDLI